ncbi:MAG TPA: hypothetical protein VL201_04825 [Patescibacteria group bacterium]|jgi:hypothetical protein|nr:hypothetical protein [Patescibacteria group bacterium]
MKALYFFIILLGFALFLGGCGRQVKSNKKNNAKLKKLVSPPLLEGIAVPFESVIEQENNEKSVLTDKSSDAVFYVHFPECSVLFLDAYYKNTMEQAGWILQKEFDTRNFLILDFCSVSRICLVCIYKDNRHLNNTKKVMLCVGQKK